MAVFGAKRKEHRLAGRGLGLWVMEGGRCAASAREGLLLVLPGPKEVGGGDVVVHDELKDLRPEPAKQGTVMILSAQATRAKA